MKRLSLLATALVMLAASSMAAQEKKNPLVVMETSMGTIKIELYPDKAPITVKNFLGYVDAKFYDGTLFHRVIGKENSEKKKDFMIQGGGFLPGLKEKKPKDPIKNEAGNGLSNKRGTIAMAREDEPDTATCEFYINVADNKFLDKGERDKHGYCVFGKVIEGMDIVDKIKAVKTKAVGEHEAVPVENIVIKSVRLAEK